MSGRCMYHRFDNATHRCVRCERWQPGFAPKKAYVKTRDECQVCERQQATHEGRMMHHGYRRPGWGSIVGDCFGVGHAPFPATDALELWRAAVAKQLARLNKSLRELPALDAVTYLKRDYNAPRGTPDKAITLLRGAKADYSLGLPSFDDQVQHIEWKLSTEIGHATRELARVERRIANAKAAK